MLHSELARYKQIYQYSVKLGGEQVQLATKAGLPSWNLASPSSQLFFEHASIKPGDAVLLFGCHLGALAISLARKFPSLHLMITDVNHTALEMTRLTLAVNPGYSINILAKIELPHALYQKFSVIYIQIPKGRLLARRWLVQAYQALPRNGSLYLGGANSSGIQSVIKDAQELFGNGRVIAYKKGNRIARFIKNQDPSLSPAWVDMAGIAPGTWVEFTVDISDHKFQMRSLPGVFSYDHLDEGTEMLLNCISITHGGAVLDVGCGYGVIGVYAASAGAGHAHLTDNNLLAITASKATLSANNITNAQVFAGDLLESVASNKYDMILSNPPFHSGLKVNRQIAAALILQSYHALNPGGQLIIVANRFLRYAQMINAVFGNTTTLAESGKFHVLSGLKSR